MNQLPTKPEGPSPGTQPTPEQETAMGQYNAQMNTYLANEQALRGQRARPPSSTWTGVRRPDRR